MNPLNVIVSAYDNSIDDQKGVDINLLHWLTDKWWNDRLKPYSDTLRAMEDKDAISQFKREYLPAITPGGRFRRRGEQHLIEPSYLMQIDIDKKENLHLTNFSQAKEELSKIANIAYLGLSASGAGFWGLVPISDPKNIRGHWEALNADLLRLGIVLDKQVKNIAGLRFYAYDAEPYINADAVTYTKTKKPVTPKYAAPSGNTAYAVEKIITKIEAQRRDLTSDYPDWFAMGCALANEFGELGRGYFHRISQFYPWYDPDKTDKQFDHCLKGRGGKTIRTFFKLTEQAGILAKT